ncbi:MAG TPA: XcyI family restriction endonuclease [Zoogloea sp.]|uniref:XcyI family restriction endonuclease n=1 Tax=Zoogloea sp. TaxID=49181 RepID=UPI002C6E5EA4|nr:XcyI family restriction endonuclease [Zoogloea sp.]HNA49158.1 XcyI family restriction endonuclease [Nitrospira sp.]HNE16668.1 XcyI family restriction endonuclease [Rhodocyclaceae bacterium]HND03985.1 XcyI family restriction endonuclease [Nitrospira sp.]HNH17807.1 XcyI family restriction endonuclease [Zoogloea sp.]HNI48736.1 XcyI family restriction endonuclease [Zoogloea sp.]
MNDPILLPSPAMQVEFAKALQLIRRRCLQDALFETVSQLSIPQLDQQLGQVAREADLALMARHGLRGELLFPVPLMLQANPQLLGYYRLLLGFSQKEFYARGRGTSRFKSMEEKGRIGSAIDIERDLAALCRALCEAGSLLLDGIRELPPSRHLLDDLTLLTVGPQLRGGVNNRLGSDGIVQVFEIIREIVSHAISSIDSGIIRIRSATGRTCIIEFSADPDIVIREEMVAGEYRNILAIEIKSGTDVSNIHNRIGEAEKSHQKARGRGFTECWTVINVLGLDMEKAHAESPTTNRFYGLAQLQSRRGDFYDDFRRRIVSLTSIPTVDNRG